VDSDVILGLRNVAKKTGTLILRTGFFSKERLTLEVKLLFGWERAIGCKLRPQEEGLGGQPRERRKENENMSLHGSRGDLLRRELLLKLDSE
jgi:hypothetical protein